jgi:hypothetical protein
MSVCSVVSSFAGLVPAAVLYGVPFAGEVFSSAWLFCCFAFLFSSSPFVKRFLGSPTQPRHSGPSPMASSGRWEDRHAAAR